MAKLTWNKEAALFFMALRKRNGIEYRPGSLSSQARSLDRHIRDSGEYWILTNKFEGCRRAFIFII